MIIDRLFNEIEEFGNVCVGLDTNFEYIPEEYAKGFESKEECVLSYNKEIIDAVKDDCSAFKVQISYYEAMGLKGLWVYSETLKYIKEKGKISIGDIKRGDIAKTAEQYAKAHFEGDFECDFITINPYMGMDSIEPYFKYIESGEKGIFPLVRTSNEGAKDIQFVQSENGNKIYEHMGSMINEAGKKFLGECGYSAIGGVVGCTHKLESAKIREDLDSMFFLIPGYGAQGGQVEVIKTLLKNGNGGIVNSSRGILMAYKKYENGNERPIECAHLEVKKMRKALSE